jgi:membrane fusion protein, multidrug efflux system
VTRRRTTGTLESPAIVNVRSRIDSQVLEQHVQDGQMVKKGQLLFTLDDRELKAAIARDEATLAKDNATLTQAESDLKRQSILADKKFASQQQYELAQATYKAAKQTVEADEAVIAAGRLRLDYAKIETPIDGRLGTVRVTPGNLVQSADTTGLVTITQIQPLRANFVLPERDATALRSALQSNPPVQVSIYTGQAKPAATGTLDFVDSSVDTASGTITAKAAIANDNLALWPGQFIEVEIDLAARPNTVMLPATAVLMGQQGPYVFIANDDQKAEVRSINLGGTDGNCAAVFDGIREGERVVVEGQSRLNPGSRWAESASPKLAEEPGSPGGAAATGSKGAIAQ